MAIIVCGGSNFTSSPSRLIRAQQKMPCSSAVRRSVLVITPARCISNLRRSFPSTFSVPLMRYKTARRILPSASGLASGIFRPLPISSVMSYCQLVPSEVGIRGAVSAVVVDMNSNADNAATWRAPNASPVRTGRGLPKLWNGFDCRSPRRLRNLRPHMSRKYCTSLSMLAVVFSLHATGFAAAPPKSERHVVIVVWDGMRPDFMSEQNTPALWKLAREGVTFRNHHAVYPSATMVNGTALLTGVYPSKNGIIANHEYRSHIDLNH